ncbi:MAG: hypothetical protein V3R77_00980 [Candidatus Binatia bacterium]
MSVELVELDELEELDPRLISSVTVIVAELVVLLEVASGRSGCFSAVSAAVSPTDDCEASLVVKAEAWAPIGRPRLQVRRQVAASVEMLGTWRTGGTICRILLGRAAGASRSHPARTVPV